MEKSIEGKQIPIIIHHSPEGPTREYRLEQLNEILQAFGDRLNKRSSVQRIELTIEDPKNPLGKVVAYGAKLHVLFYSGKSYIASANSFVAKAQHLGLETNVREAEKEILKQIESDEER
jgi:hypothetical protein